MPAGAAQAVVSRGPDLQDTRDSYRSDGFWVEMGVEVRRDCSLDGISLLYGIFTMYDLQTAKVTDK